MIDYLHDAAVDWLGLTLLVAAGLSVLVVDLARELTSDDVGADGASRQPRWIHWVAFALAPLLIIGAAIATVVRIFTLA